MKIGIVTVSDRAHQGVYEDKGGPAIYNWLKEVLLTEWEACSKVLPDERDQLEAFLKELVDEKGCQLVFTTGGTGPAPRDITPEATLAVADKVMDGFGERMRSIGLQYVPTAILSRQTAVIRKKCLIVNLPGQPASIQQTLDELFVVIPYCIELIGGELLRTKPEVMETFRPKSK